MTRFSKLKTAFANRSRLRIDDKTKNYLDATGSQKSSLNLSTRFDALYYGSRALRMLVFVRFWSQILTRKDGSGGFFRSIFQEQVLARFMNNFSVMCQRDCRAWFLLSDYASTTCSCESSRKVEYDTAH